MEPLDTARIAYLRSQLATARSERNRLIRQIHSPLTATARKSNAKARYAKVDTNLRNVVAELEEIIAAHRIK
jgi:hypothetical protein